MATCFLLFLFTVISLTGGISEVCFVLTTSAVRRDSIRVIPATSQVQCNLECVVTPGCDACMYYSDRGKCVHLGKARAPPPGSCTPSYTCYERRTSGCPMFSPPKVDRGYTPGPCSRASDVVGPPLIGPEVLTPSGADFPCGIPASGQRVIDAELHDGNRLVLENEIMANVAWDPYLASWYYQLKRIPYYFKRATCVVPPAMPLSAACDCPPIPTEQPGSVPNPEKPVVGAPSACSGSMLLLFKRTINGWTGLNQQLGGAIKCSMGEFIFLNSAGYNEISISAATCL